VTFGAATEIEAMKSVSFTRARLVALVGLVATLAACGDDGSTDPATPNAIAKVSADSQTTAVGVAMAQPLVVKVTGGGGAPVPNVEVVWGILAGGGTFNDTTTMTDAEGNASVTYTPGTTPGRAEVGAAVPGISTSFVLTLVAGPASALLKFGSDNPAVVKGSVLTLGVKMADAFGNGIAGGVVTWSADGGTVSTATSTTDTGGVATVTFTTGAAAGRYNLTATVPGLPPTTFVITAI
jgi:adhesin/invasin